MHCHVFDKAIIVPSGKSPEFRLFQGICQRNADLNITNKLIKSFATALASFNETTIDDCQPILSGTLETGERVQVVVPPAVEKKILFL